MKTVLIILLLSISLPSLSQDEVAEYIARGNEFYKQEQYDKAIHEYDRALQINPNNSTAKFNMANALYKQKKQTEALRVYTDVTNTSREAPFRSKNFYNKGVVYTRQKKLEESIEEYKNALRLNPDDKEARENLQKALLELKKQDQQQNKQDQNKKNQQQSQSRLNQKQAEQKLDQLEQKQKETQEKVQKSKNKSTGGTGKDW